MIKMKNITIIYPDGSAHQVSAIAVQRYRLNGNSFNVLVYADGDSTCITLLAEIGGTLCKIPFHDIDFENAELLGEILPDRLPNIILSAVLLEPGQDMTEAYEQLQIVANQAEAEGQFFTQIPHPIHPTVHAFMVTGPLSLELHATICFAA